MAQIKSYTDFSQSKKLVEILPIESADMHYYKNHFDDYIEGLYNSNDLKDGFELKGIEYVPAWSLAALYDALPEIENIPPTLEKVKAEDGYEGYYYHIEYKDKIMIPYSKNPIDACYIMVMKLHELNLL